jgi:hypothetical protein
MSIEIPEANTALALDDSTEWEQIAELLGLDEAEAEELEAYIPDPYGMRGVVIASDLTIEGDTTTMEIAKGNWNQSNAMTGQVGAAHSAYVEALAEDGYDGLHEDFVLVVLGDLKVTGTLNITQYRPLYVLGEVHAKNILGHTGNVVAKGAIHAAELIVWNTNSEGGLIWSPAIQNPVMVETEYPRGVRWQNEKDETQHEEDLTPMAEVLSQILGKTVTPRDVYFAIAEAINDGRGGEVIAEFINVKKN